MSSRFVKVACAAAMSLPLAGMAMSAAHATNYAPENDCNRHFSGAITGTPHQSDACYGIDQRRVRDGASNHLYTVASDASSTTLPGSLTVTARCLDGHGVRDTAVDVNASDGGGVTGPVTAIFDGSRPVGYFATFNTTGGRLIVTCADDHTPSQA